MKSLSFSLRCLLMMVAVFLLVPAGIAAAATYIVQPGDSLYTISINQGTTVAALRAANGLTDSLIYPGQTLTIPGKNKSYKLDAGSRYTVQPGDTLYTIGRCYGISPDSIIAANGLSGSVIYPGQQLIIPGISQENSDPAPTAAPQVSRGTLFNGPVSFNRDDFDLLARLITAEADNQSFNTKVAVGAVVLNRTHSNIFPHTIPGVIYQVDGGCYQFEPVMNGWINRPASEEAKEAALAALSGDDPTNGALYFFDTSVTNPWLWSRPGKIKMDSFIFTH